MTTVKKGKHIQFSLHVMFASEKAKEVFGKAGCCCKGSFDT